MQLSLPYVTGIYDYIDTLPEDKQSTISDVYFSDSRLSNSARFMWYDNETAEDDKWVEILKLKHEKNIQPQYVINPSVWDNNVYTTGLDKFKKMLDKVWSKGCTWLTINNPLLLRMQEFRNDIPPFKIKLSINNHVSTLEEVIFTHDTIGLKHIILDRSVNRDMDEIKRIHRWTKERDISLTLLAQEGCITNCQWKSTCDNMIATHRHHDLHEVNDTQNIHTLNLCSRYYNDVPQAILKSPWIIPSMLNDYDKYIDYMKLSGREKSIEQLKDCFRSYIFRDNNVLINQIVPKCHNKIGNINVLDVQETAADSKWLNCKSKCADCDFCDKIYERIINR